MKTLIEYEFLKILCRKSTLAAMAVSLLATAFLFGLPVLQFQTYREDGAVRGLEGIAYEKAQYADLTVPLTDDYLARTIGEYHSLFENPDNVGYDGSESFLIGDAYWGFVAPREKLLNVVAANYEKPGESSGLNRLLSLDVTGGARFYEARQEKIEALLAMPSRALSERQKDYWRGLNSRVETPLPYGYSEGWQIILSSFELLMFALLAVLVAIAPVFCGEYQTGADAVILAARYGKTRLATAKTLASLLFGAAAFTLHVAVAFGLPLWAFGTDGWNLPVQIANTLIPYPFTFLEAVLANLGVVYLVLLSMIGLTLLLSARMKSAFAVLGVLLPVLLLPMFLAPNGTTGFYNLFLLLLPYRATMPELGKYVSYELCGVVMDVEGARALLYAALALALLPLGRLGFRRHQVS